MVAPGPGTQGAKIILWTSGAGGRGEPPRDATRRDPGKDTVLVLLNRDCVPAEFMARLTGMSLPAT